MGWARVAGCDGESALSKVSTVFPLERQQDLASRGTKFIALIRGAILLSILVVSPVIDSRALAAEPATANAAATAALGQGGNTIQGQMDATARALAGLDPNSQTYQQDKDALMNQYNSLAAQRDALNQAMAQSQAQQPMFSDGPPPKGGGGDSPQKGGGSPGGGSPPSPPQQQQQQNTPSPSQAPSPSTAPSQAPPPSPSPPPQPSDTPAPMASDTPAIDQAASQAVAMQAQQQQMQQELNQIKNQNQIAQEMQTQAANMKANGNSFQNTGGPAGKESPPNSTDGSGSGNSNTIAGQIQTLTGSGGPASGGGGALSGGGGESAMASVLPPRSGGGFDASNHDPSNADFSRNSGWATSSTSRAQNLSSPAESSPPSGGSSDPSAELASLILPSPSPVPTPAPRSPPTLLLGSAAQSPNAPPAPPPQLRAVLRRIQPEVLGSTPGAPRRISGSGS